MSRYCLIGHAHVQMLGRADHYTGGPYVCKLRSTFPPRVIFFSCMGCPAFRTSGFPAPSPTVGRRSSAV